MWTHRKVDEVAAGRQHADVQEAVRGFAMQWKTQERRHKRSHPLKPFICNLKFDTIATNLVDFPTYLYIPLWTTLNFGSSATPADLNCESRSAKICLKTLWEIATDVIPNLVGNCDPFNN